MHRIWGVAMGLVLAAAAPGDDAVSAGSKKLTDAQYDMIFDQMRYWSSQHGRYSRIKKRAEELRPARRNEPLRELNITDDEVREVQAIAVGYLPRDLVNISPVVTACPCEEGPTCTAQVYVVATGKGKTSGLQLSRMNQAWQVGVVQQWWLKRSAVKVQNTGNATLDGFLYEKAVNDLLEEFPVCLGPIVPPAQRVSLSKTQEKK
jgi:hypothetical protein